MKHWTADDRDEFEAACADAWESGECSHERTDAFVRIVADAEHAQRPWATDVREDAERIGLSAKLKSWKKRHRVMFAFDGEQLTKPSVIGIKRSSAAGSDTDVQALIHLVSWDELIEKRREYLGSIKAYTSNVALIDRLLALRDACPGASSPEQAASRLGTSVEAWLSNAA